MDNNQNSMRPENENAAGGAHLRPDEKKSGGKKALTAILAVLAVAVLGVGAYLGVKALQKNQQPQETAANVESEAPTQESGFETGVMVETEFVEPTVEIVDAEEYEPDQALLDAIAENDDVVGVLNYGMASSLYIVHGDDNSYYLNHDYQRNSSWTGAPFADYRCKLDPRDTVVMIHGHNMKNGTIFSDLINFYDQEYMFRYPIFTLSTATEQEVYVPFAVSDIEAYENAADYVDIVKWNFDTDEEFNDYVKIFTDRSVYKLPVTAEPGDDLLLLLTCNYKSGTNGDGRLVVCLRRVRDDENVDDLKAMFEEMIPANAA